jgi:hypothetical protein
LLVVGLVVKRAQKKAQMVESAANMHIQEILTILFLKMEKMVVMVAAILKLM